MVTAHRGAPFLYAVYGTRLRRCIPCCLRARAPYAGRAAGRIPEVIMNDRKVSDSDTIMTHRGLPQDANPAGNIHGGTILKHIDLAGAVAAMRHARGRTVVTASIDRMEFKAAVHVGELMVL